MRILFMGTPDFAVPCLEKLYNEGHEIIGAVSQPDKPKGRGHKLVPTPLKACAENLNIPVFQPETLKDNAFLPVLEELNPEIIVVVAYGKILPEYILNFPKYGCINVHGSLLPKYRGAAPIQWAVINGEKETGVTTMYMGKGLDTGDMLLKATTPIGEYETSGELFDRLSLIGADLIAETLVKLEKGEVSRQVQNEDEATYAPIITKETGFIDWSKTAREIINLIRGCNPWPVASTTYKGEILKIYSAEMGDPTSSPAGTILGIKNKCLEVACGDKSILIKEIQFFGGKRMTVESYINGHEIDLKEILGG